jgi:hypothetical protein
MNLQAEVSLSAPDFTGDSETFSLNPDNPRHFAILEKNAFRLDPIGLLKASYLTIKTKEGNFSAFRMNSSQIRIVSAIQSQRKKGLPVRIVILKSRQLGISTLSQAVLFAFCSQRGVSQGLVLADDDEGASDIFKMNEIFYECLSRDHPHLAPERSRSDERRMEFAHTKSSIRIETAKNRSAGRKYTYRYAHLTEVAFYPRFKELMAGLLPSIPDQPETILILETTANGLGEFHEFWKEKSRAAEEGRTDWIPLFLPWKDHAEYQRPFPSQGFRDRFLETMSRDEKDIQARFNLSLEQMNWRRHQVEDLYNGDEEKFSTEYPLTDREAFKSTSRRVFADRLTEPQKVYQILPKDAKFRGEMALVGRAPSFLPDPKGVLTLYKEVQPEFRYVIGTDSCESAISNDEACAQVLCRETWEQVAHLHGHIAPDEFARMLFALGFYYHLALIAPERNGPGAVTVQKLCEMYYPNLCKTQKLVFDDGGRPHETEEHGFHTNSKTKPLLIDRLQSALRDLLLVLHSPKTIEELESFVVRRTNEEGYSQMGAEEGERDDCVIALGLAVWFAQQLPSKAGASGGVERPNFLTGSRSGYG